MTRIAILAVSISLLFAAGCGGLTGADDNGVQEQPPAAAEPKPVAEAASPAPSPEIPAVQVSTPAPAVPAAPANPVVVMKTNKGTIEIELFPDKAPVTVENFLSYVKSGFYTGTIFHRVIPAFMIQGGGMGPDMVEKVTQRPIKNEANNGLSNSRGTISMARTNNPGSATCQFFINVVDNKRLDYIGPGREGYAVFGKVVAGMDVADAIVRVPTRSAGINADVPTEPVIIESITLKTK